MIDAPSSTWFTVSPHWQWLLALYFFFGGLAGGSYFLAALIDLSGREEDRPLAKIGYWIALPCIVIGALALLFDLARPLRFWHLLVQNNTLLPMFKYWSPISIGSWALVVFGAFALLSALGFRNRVFVAIGALVGLYIAGYAGVLFSVTNRPLWSDTPLLGMLLLVSGVSISAALMVLLGRRWRPASPGVAALTRIDVQVLVLAMIVLAAFIFTLGAAAQALLAWHNVLLLLGTVLIGMVAPLVLHWRRDWLGGAATAAALVLAGGFLLRVLIVFMPYGIHR
jgi:formate-dependent nitrite reductase membrane component NrfD